MCINYSRMASSSLTYSEAVQAVGDSYSCFKLQTSVLHLALPPKYIGDIRTGVKEQLSSELKLYSEKLDGVVIAFDNVKVLQPVGTIMDSQPWIHIDVQADFVIFKPIRGSVLKGTVNKLGSDHIGCLVHNCFNASIPKPFGSQLNWQSEFDIDQELTFEVTGIHTHNGIVSIRGKLHNYNSQNHRENLSAEDVSLSKSKKRKADTSFTSTVTDVSDMPEIMSPRKKHKKSDVSSNTLDTGTIDSSSGLAINSDYVDGEGKKKKKKKKKDKNEMTEMDISSEVDSTHKKKKKDKSCQEDVVESSPSQVSSEKKKKRKKDRNRLDDYNESSNTVNSDNLKDEIINQEDVDSTLQLDHEVKKVKKKKNKKIKLETPDVSCIMPISQAEHGQGDAGLNFDRMSDSSMVPSVADSGYDEAHKTNGNSSPVVLGGDQVKKEKKHKKHKKKKE